MKTRFKNVTASLRAEFHPSGTISYFSNSFSQEQVSPGPTLRNDPLFRKLPATWSYTIYNRVGLNDYDSSEKPSHKVRYANGLPKVEYSGCYGNHVPDPTQADFDNSSVLNRALSRLNDQVRGNLDLSIALAESGKTAKMVKNAGKVITFAGNHRPPGGYPVLPKLGPLRRFSDVTHALANGYLEFKYGWKQLLSDVFNVADESIRFTMNQLQRFSASASDRQESDVVYITSVNGESNVPLKVKWVVVRKARYCVKLLIPNSSFDIARWTSLNPVSLGWELIPYSFVVDWFVDIGSYLRNFETSCYYNTMFQNGYKSSLSVHTSEGSVDGYKSTSAFDGSKTEINGLQNSSKVINFARTPLYSYPTPSLPKFQVDLGSSQLTSAAALLRQFLRRI